MTTGGGAGREGGEYARVTKPPPAYKRTKSDQKPSEDGGDKKPGSPRERDRGQKSAGSTSSSPYQSPLPIRKSGDTPSAEGRGGKNYSGYGSGGEGVIRGGGRLGVAPPSRPPPRAPVGATGKKRWSAAEVEGEGRKREDSPLLMVSRMKSSSDLGGEEGSMPPLLKLFMLAVFDEISNHTVPKLYFHLTPLS